MENRGPQDAGLSKKNVTFHYTGCFIGIPIMVYYNPHKTGQYNPLYTLNNQGFFHCSRDTEEVGKCVISPMLTEPPTSCFHYPHDILVGSVPRVGWIVPRVGW